MRWPERTYLIHRERKFIYCPIPKVAMSSLKLWVLQSLEPSAGTTNSYEEISQKLQQRSTLGALPRHEARKILRSAEYLRFVFVRNPWSRLVSGYLNKIVPASRYALPFQRALARRRWWRLGSRRQPEERLSFANFVRLLAQSGVRRSNRHWRPQSLFLGSHPFDYVGRFESLGEDVSRLNQRLGMDVALTCRNSTRYGQHEQPTECVADWGPERLHDLKRFPDYRAFYTPELAAQVEELYRCDVERFGYTFDGTYR